MDGNTVAQTLWHCGTNRQPVGSVGGAPDYCAGDRGSIPGRTNTQGLKITEEKVLPL